MHYLKVPHAVLSEAKAVSLIYISYHSDPSEQSPTIMLSVSHKMLSKLGNGQTLINKAQNELGRQHTVTTMFHQLRVISLCPHRHTRGGQ